jgi:hypothetical protein
MKYKLLQGLGLFIGVGIIGPLIIRYYEKQTINFNETGRKKVDEYIANSKTVKLFMHCSFEGTGETRNERFDDRWAKYHSSGDRRGKIVDICTYPFYSEEYKKFFCIQMYNPWGRIPVEIESKVFNDTIVATVNTLQLNDTSYGSEKKPIPIFNMKMPDTSADSILNTKPDEYRDYVGEYLMYSMSKKDFEKMFGKQ